jgi:hypothetical protein
MIRTILAAAVAIIFTAGAALAQRTIGPEDGVPVGSGGRSTTDTPKPTTGKGATSKPVKPPKYQKPTEMEIRQSEALMGALFAQAVKEVNPNLHKVETAHFVIFSGIGPAPSKPGAPPSGIDKAIGETMERMYKVLCQQFDIAENESVWVGKCGIFLLTQNPDKQFFNFATKVDGLDEKIANGAAGYFRSTAIQSYLVMKPPPDERHEWELDYWKSTLIHESTHAFLFRYVSNKTVPTWLNEGIAETSAASVMNSKTLARRLKQANKDVFAARDAKDPSPVFKSVSLSEFDYGISQSWVRFLLLKDHKAFIKFVTLCKEGMDDQEAMKEAYKFSRDDFLKAWAAWARNVR